METKKTINLNDGVYSTRNKKGQFGAIDRTGYRGAYYEIIEKTDLKHKDGSSIWKARCDCGKIFTLSAGRINTIKSCGCMKPEWATAREWAGKTIKGFKVIEATGNVDNNGYLCWMVECEFCKQKKEYPSYYLKRRVLSCDCDKWGNEYAEKIGRKSLPNKQSHVNTIYRHYERAAKDRNLSFEISKEDFRSLIEKECFYCGKEPEIHYTSKNLRGKYKWNGVDRVDNTKGYSLSNCVPCCKQCNFSKRDLKQEEFLKWIEAVYKHSLESR